jgi:hypothetical protein
MRRKVSHWPMVGVVSLAVFCAFAVGGWVATKWVSPCLCIYAAAKTGMVQ